MAAPFRIAAFGLGLLATPALAQPAGSGADVTKQPAPSTVQGGETGSLSSKLSKSGGVIQPSGDVDPGIKTQPPVANPGSTPVVPPSATGGDTAK